ncbi:MAG: hypothetical protein HYT80_05825 [Euryarchaeota archaeon]|nr:hypothetical protein [Euryarchaeota archaeon]
MRLQAGIVLVLATSAFVGATATGQDAPAGEGALYFTNKLITDPGATGVKKFEMTDVAPTAAAPVKAYAMTSAFASTYQTQFEYKFPADTVLNGKMTVKTWVSCDVLAPFRPAYQNTQNDLQALRVELYKGTTLLGEAHHYNSLAACTGPSVVHEISVQVPLDAVEMAKGDILGVRPLLWTTNPPEAQAKNVHFLVGGGTRISAIRGEGLPGASPAGAGPVAKLVEETLDGSAATVSHSFDNTTSDTYRFNWTTETVDFEVAAGANATNGTVHVTAKDGSGNETLNFTLPGAAGESEFNSTLANTTAGTWVIELAYADFQGTFDFNLSPFVPAAVGGNATDQGNATENATAASAPDEGGLPGLEIVGATLAIAAAVFVRRRRA